MNSNGNWKKFVEFCNDNALFILNEFWQVDTDEEFTFVSSAVHDICAVSLTTASNVDQFKVGRSLTSDHFPIEFTLNIKGLYTYKMTLTYCLS